MTFARLIEDAIGRLSRAGIPYMVTGSVASSYYGEPRATRDLDIVIDPDVHSLDVLIEGLRAGGFYVDRDAAHDDLDHRTQFNAIASDAFKIAGVLAVGGDDIDHAYLRKWIKTRSLERIRQAVADQ